MGTESPRSKAVVAAMIWLARVKWGGFVVLDDPPVHVAGHGTRTPTVSMALELRVFLLELESCFFELLVLRP